MDDVHRTLPDDLRRCAAAALEMQSELRERGRLLEVSWSEGAALQAERDALRARVAKLVGLEEAARSAVEYAFEAMVCGPAGERVCDECGEDISDDGRDGHQGCTWSALADAIDALDRAADFDRGLPAEKT